MTETNLFFGLHHILECVLNNTEDLHPNKSNEERKQEILKIIYRKPVDKANASHRPTLNRESDEYKLFIAVAKERRKARKSGNKIPDVKTLIKKHINLIKYIGTEDNAAKRMAEKYNAAYADIEQSSFLDTYDEKMAEADETTHQILSENYERNKAKIDEIMACLRKHGWPENCK